VETDAATDGSKACAACSYAGAVACDVSKISTNAPCGAARIEIFDFVTRTFVTAIIHEISRIEKYKTAKIL